MSPDHRRRAALRFAALGLCTSAMLAAGCGGDDDGGDAATVTTTTEQAAPKEVVVQTASDDFNPIQIYERAAPGVVTVLSVFANGEATLGDQSAGQGSGFILNEEGVVITNAYVVSQGEGGQLSEADEVYVEFADRNRVEADVLGVDPFADVALLKIDPAELDLVPLGLGDDAALAVGEPVAAIGSPFGEQQSLTIGIVSAKERSVRSLTQFQIENSIQTDTAINPGNSGGPLLNSNAEVVGINQQIETRSNANAGVGFAVPISGIKRSIEDLREDGEVEYAYMGVQSQALYPQLSERLDLDTEYGALISRVVPGGPADDGGLEGADESIRFQATPVRTGGDVILSLDGQKVIEPSDLSRFVSQKRPDDEVTLEIISDGDRETLEVTLGERPTTG